MLFTGYYVTETESYDIIWTMPHCVLTLRLSGLAFDVYDGKMPKVSNVLFLTSKNHSCVPVIGIGPGIVKYLDHGSDSSTRGFSTK